MARHCASWASAPVALGQGQLDRGIEKVSRLVIAQEDTAVVGDAQQASQRKYSVDDLAFPLLPDFAHRQSARSPGCGSQDITLDLRPAPSLARQCDEEVQESPDLGRHELCGMMVCVERKRFLRPLREYLHQPSVGQEFARIEFEHLCDSLAPETRREKRTHFIHHELPGCLHGDRLPAAHKLPAEMASGRGIPHQNALVFVDVARQPRHSAAGRRTPAKHK